MKRFFLTLLTLTTTGLLFAQSLNSLTPEQLELYKKYKSGTTSSTSSTSKTNEIEETEREKPTDQINAKLPIQKKITLLEDSTEMSKFKEFLDAENNKSPQIFGSQLFKDQDLTFEPKLNIPTPPNYILGTYDELIIDLTGLYEANYKLRVSPEGNVRIPAIGLVKVGGQTVEAASSNIRNRMSKIYTGIGSGQTHINISLGNIRSIRVTVIGEATKPGSYTIPSLSTAFNALYACGGPGKNGSMRDIKVLRKGKIIANIDMYRFLIDGVTLDNIALQDEDVLRIEPYQKRVTIIGEVKHPAIFEALAGETLQDLIRFAGGFTENATKRIITALRIAENQKSVVDVTEEQFGKFELNSGDQYTVTKTYNTFENRIYLTGSVYRPGVYALEPNMKLKQLLQKADGVTDDAYLNMATIYRKRENAIPEIIGFNLKSILNNQADDIPLQKNDSIHIGKVTDFREKELVSIWGAVKEPGTYKLEEYFSVKDLIFKAKGFTEMASTDSIELIRIVKDPQKLLSSDQKSTILKIKLDKDMNLKSDEGNVKLQNGDQVIVRSISGYENIRMVKIEGEVMYPGSYNILFKTERLSDLLRRAGGLTRFAFPSGAYLIRTEKTSGVEGILKQKMVENAKKQMNSNSSSTIDSKLLKDGSINDIKNIKEELSGAKSAEQLLKAEGIVGINLDEIIANPKSKHDLFIEEGDILFIPQETQTVRVLGEILFPTYIGYIKGQSLKSYISSAGGFSDQAQKSKTFVLYANGSAKSTRSFMGIRSYPPIKPGSQIVVPERPIELKQKMSTAELVSIMSSIATVAVLIVSIFK